MRLRRKLNQAEIAKAVAIHLEREEAAERAERRQKAANAYARARVMEGAATARLAIAETKLRKATEESGAIFGDLAAQRRQIANELELIKTRLGGNLVDEAQDYLGGER